MSLFPKKKWSTPLTLEVLELHRHVVSMRLMQSGGSLNLTSQMLTLHLYKIYILFFFT